VRHAAVMPYTVLRLGGLAEAGAGTTAEQAVSGPAATAAVELSPAGAGRYDTVAPGEAARLLLFCLGNTAVLGRTFEAVGAAPVRAGWSLPPLYAQVAELAADSAVGGLAAAEAEAYAAEVEAEAVGAGGTGGALGALRDKIDGVSGWLGDGDGHGPPRFVPWAELALAPGLSRLAPTAVADAFGGGEGGNYAVYRVLIPGHAHACTHNLSTRFATPLASVQACQCMCQPPTPWVRQVMLLEIVREDNDGHNLSLRPTAAGAQPHGISATALRYANASGPAPSMVLCTCLCRQADRRATSAAISPAVLRVCHAPWRAPTRIGAR
jgi:hypothetical protein